MSEVLGATNASMECDVSQHHQSSIPTIHTAATSKEVKMAEEEIYVRI